VADIDLGRAGAIGASYPVAMYIALVVAQTVVLPAVSGAIELALQGGDPVLVFGRWFLFWGVGTRLFVAGISQIARPGFTSGLLGIAGAGTNQLVQELGFSNVIVGAVAILAAAFVPDWQVPAAIIGGTFLGLAGVRHVAKRGMERAELVATWTDLIVGAAMVIFVAANLMK
jgi:hypothetical protein